MKLLGMSGALRRESTNKRLMREAARLADPAEFREADLNLPLYDGDLEAEGIPAGVITLGEAVDWADAVVISTPEYNKGPSGAMKNAFDWLSRLRPMPIAGKPVAVVSASAGIAGGQRSKSQVYLTLLALNARLVPNPEVNLGQSEQKFDADGRLTDETAEKLLGTLMKKLRESV